MTVLEELQCVIDRIEFESQHTEAIRIITKYLHKRAVQRLDETTQARRLEEAYHSADAKKVRDFRLSQFGRVRQQADDFLSRLGDNSSEVIRTKHLPVPEEVPCE
jgi:hypothetical protein